MKKKVLAIIAGEFQKLYFKPILKKYHFYFYIFEFHKTPQQQIKEILQFLKEKKITLDGIFGVNDEPSLIAAHIAQILHLPGPTPRSIYRGLHKPLFTTYAAKVNKHYPRTEIVLSENHSLQHITYPAFIKPARSSFSTGALAIHSPEEFYKNVSNLFQRQLKEITWFDYYFQEYKEKNDYPITSLILQPFIKAKQYTVDGYIFNGTMSILGVTKSVFTKDKKSFDRFVFPSRLSERVFKELTQTLRHLFQEIALDNTNFNVEFFVYKQHIILIELNTRLSIQFSSLMDKWYTINNLDIATHIALGINPPVHILKDKKMAVSYVLRRKKDGYVKRVPSQKEIAIVIKSGYADLIQLLVEKGKKLSDYRQDEYSYRYAIVDISGKDEKETKKKFAFVKRTLSFTFT